MGNSINSLERYFGNICHPKTCRFRGLWDISLKTPSRDSGGSWGRLRAFQPETCMAFAIGKAVFSPNPAGHWRGLAPDASGRRSRWRCGTGEAGWPSPRQGLLSLRLNWTKIKVVWRRFWTKVKVVLRDTIFAVQHPPRSTTVPRRR